MALRRSGMWLMPERNNDREQLSKGEQNPEKKSPLESLCVSTFIQRARLKI